MLPVLPPIVALLGAAVAAAGRRSRMLQRTVSTLAVGAGFVVGMAMVAHTRTGAVLVAVPGGWPAEIGIALTAGPFAALMVTVSALLAGATMVTMVLRADDHHPFLHPVVLGLLAGVWATFVAGDLFNLFVAFELTLIASYVLLVIGGGRRELRAAAVYVSVNLLGSLTFLVGIGLLYGTTGSVSVAVLATGAAGPATGTAEAVILLAILLKAGLLPLGGWLRVAYPVAPPAVAALFAGLLTTVGIVALYRVVLLGFGFPPAVRVVVLVVALATALVAAATACAVRDRWAVLSLVVLAQVGFMALGIGIGTRTAVAAAVFFTVQDTLVKTAIFLGVATSDDVGTDGHEVAAARPVLAATVGVAALSLAGVPPTSGFVGKALLIGAAIEGGQVIAAAAVLVASLAVLAAVGSVWSDALWRPAAESAEARTRSPRRRRAAMAPAAALVGLALVLGILPQPLHQVAGHAADMLLDPSAYAAVVLEQP